MPEIYAEVFPRGEKITYESFHCAIEQGVHRCALHLIAHHDGLLFDTLVNKQMNEVSYHVKVHKRGDISHSIYAKDILNKDYNSYMILPNGRTSLEYKSRDLEKVSDERSNFVHYDSTKIVPFREAITRIVEETKYIHIRTCDYIQVFLAVRPRNRPNDDSDGDSGDESEDSDSNPMFDEVDSDESVNPDYYPEEDEESIGSDDEYVPERDYDDIGHDPCERRIIDDESDDENEQIEISDDGSDDSDGSDEDSLAKRPKLM